jgi:hypothetical protein
MEKEWNRLKVGFTGEERRYVARSTGGEDTRKHSGGMKGPRPSDD